MCPQPLPIRVLDDATIDRIAAGEVVERPASVIKELCENALDAGATSLAIELEEGGLARLAVEDDGSGIPFRELPLAFERHATSKITSAADIMRVGTFGFRGEALASIASVSRTTMVSRCDDESMGGLIEIDGGAIQRKEPAPRNRGTTVTVEDLFYNTPARRKFMKTPQAERQAIVRAVTVLALANWDIRWLLREDDKVLIDLAPARSLPERARDLLGESVSQELVRFEKEKGGFSVAGLASTPTFHRNNRSNQYIFVNRRVVDNPALSTAIHQAYREVVPPGKHPVVIAFLQLPPGEVDVNVHPAKTEVRLLLERQAFGLLRGALEEGLDLRGADHMRPLANVDLDATPAADVDRLLADEAQRLREHLSRGGSAGYEHRGVPRGQGELFGASALRPEPDAQPAPSAMPVGGGATGEANLHTAPFWQLHRTYIVTQIRGGLVIIDQHNSHERILYNQARQTLAGGDHQLPTQQLLFPAHLDLSPPQLQAFIEQRDALRRLGFLVQPFGGQSVLVQGIPTSLKNWNEGQLLLDMLDDLAGLGESAIPGDGDNEQQNDLLASFACHGAVRAGEPLTVPEMQNLVDQLFATDKPLSCPHGRPTLIQFTLEELEKRFGRRK